MAEQADIDRVRENILERLKDLQQKISSNEPRPEKPQDIDLLVEIDDQLESCLNNWYY